MIMTTSARNTIYAVIAAAAFTISMFAIHGCATKPPTAFERGMYNIQTNMEPVLVVKTNVIPVTIMETNVVRVTNEVGVINFQTNLVPVFVYHTNVVYSTNAQESYIYTPGPGAANVRQIGTEVGNIFGVGGMVGTALGALFSLWGYIRSRKSNAVSVNLSQTIETMREFVKSLPNGAVYDSELVNWMTTNQANAGVLQQVIALIAAQVSNPDARVASQQVIATIEALRNLPNTPPAGKV